MKISKFLFAAILASAVTASAVNAFAATPDSIPAAAPAAIKLAGVTGEVKIKTANGVMTVKKGEPVPDIPAGAEIIVVSGEATVESGGLTVKAGAGDSFTVTPGASGIAIAVTGGLVSVVDAKGVSKDVAKGESTTAAAVTTTVVTKTETKTETKTDTDIPPAETVTVVTTYVFTTSNTQESATTTTTTCPPVTSTSAPCP